MYLAVPSTTQQPPVTYDELPSYLSAVTCIAPMSQTTDDTCLTPAANDDAPAGDGDDDAVNNVDNDDEAADDTAAESSATSTTVRLTDSYTPCARQAFIT